MLILTPSYPPHRRTHMNICSNRSVLSSNTVLGGTSLPSSKPAQPDHSTEPYSPPYLPEVVPRRDGLFCKLVIQPAKRIVRITFRRGFIKITVPFNLNSYHTTLNERERQCEFFKLSSINVSSNLSDTWGSFPQGQEQPHFWSQAQSHTLLDGLSSCLRY